MRVLKQIAIATAWFFLWAVIPALILYPLGVWAASHTAMSEYALGQSYMVGVGLRWLPTGFLVDFLYRRFVPDRRSKNSN
jgi:hypothetical protein